MEANQNQITFRFSDRDRTIEGPKHAEKYLRGTADKFKAGYTAYDKGETVFGVRMGWGLDSSLWERMKACVGKGLNVSFISVDDRDMSGLLRDATMQFFNVYTEAVRRGLIEDESGVVTIDVKMENMDGMTGREADDAISKALPTGNPSAGASKEPKTKKSKVSDAEIAAVLATTLNITAAHRQLYPSNKSNINGETRRRFKEIAEANGILLK